MKSLFIISLLMLSLTVFGQGKIDKAEKSLKKEEQSSSFSTWQTGVSNSRDNDDFTDNPLLQELSFLILKGASLVTYGFLFESPFEMNQKGHNASLTQFPYINKQKGNYSYTNDNTKEVAILLENNFVMEDKSFYGNDLKTELRFLKRFAIELEYLQLWENAPDINNNSLAMYQALAKYYRIRTEKFDAWWALGASYVDGTIDQVGFSYGLGGSLFVAHPLSIGVNFDQTFINSNTINKLNALLNYHKGRGKISTGYQHLKLGSVRVPMLSFGIGLYL